MFRSLAKKQGNAFYVNSTYAAFSTVWHYSDGRIIIYELVKGKIYSKNDYPSNTQLITGLPKDTWNELVNCSELDGGGFGFKIIDGDTLIEEEFATRIECLKKGGFQTQFLNDIAQDMTVHKIWDVIYDE